MKVIINGELREVVSTNLKEIIESLNFDIHRYVFVVNGEILPKSKVSETTIKENDEIEILTIMGGG